MKILYVQERDSGKSRTTKPPAKSHEVLWANSGTEALAILVLNPDTTAMVVDPDVQDMSRPELLCALRKESPNSRLILSAMTGSEKNKISEAMRKEYNIEAVFTWDATAWAYLLGKEISGRPAAEYDVRNNLLALH